jgi:single-strand selective monofunctional uracil DNA glycosylase
VLVVDVCDPHLRAVIRAITPGCVAGIGKYAAEQTRRVVSELGLGVSTPCLLHPSPANPLANWNWEETVETELLSAGIRLPS